MVLLIITEVSIESHYWPLIRCLRASIPGAGGIRPPGLWYDDDFGVYSILSGFACSRCVYLDRYVGYLCAR